MAILKVLLNQKGQVVGTARTGIAISGPNAPHTASVVARTGQRLVEVDISDTMDALEPAALHAAVKTRYVKPAKKGRTRKA